MNTTNEAIAQNNKLIAEFLGKKYKDGYIVIGNWNKCNQNPSGEVWEKPKYHLDWNWLMEVVEKIESLGVVVEIRENVCYIETTPKDYFSELETTKIEAVYNACVEFIKWHNENK